MIHIKKPLLFFLFLIITIRVSSQTTVLKDVGFWFTMSNKVKITDKFYFNNELQFRRVDFVKNPQVFYIKPSLNYKIGKNVTFGAGYMFFRAHVYGESHPIITRNENRLWQMVAIKSKTRKATFTNRFMFEERFKGNIVIENDTPYISGTVYAQRFRYRLSAAFNLFKLKNEKYILGKVTEEIRIRFNNGISDPDFDQNNFNVYLGYSLLDNSKIWLGYGKDYYKINSDVFWTIDILRISWNYDFDFSKRSN